jgi:hypothetical protein
MSEVKDTCEHCGCDWDAHYAEVESLQSELAAKDKEIEGWKLAWQESTDRELAKDKEIEEAYLYSDIAQTEDIAWQPLYAHKIWHW